MRSVCILTLGCRVNQYDSQVLREEAQRAGWSPCDDPALADAVVLNSCTVTAAADADARRLLRRVRRDNPKALLALVGCLPADGKHPLVDLVLGPARKFTLFERIKDPLGAHWPFPITRFPGRRRPILKVQDGCPYRCSFCIVPGLRGGPVSRPKTSVLEEARRLAAGGASEVVLAGIQLSSYGLDLGRRVQEPRLAPLVEALLKVPGIRRVRLSSYGVAGFEEGLLGLMDRESGLCPHLHLPLQSGDERVLRAMRRPYTLAAFRRTVEKARRRVPGIGLTTDVIAGFPGETEEAFGRTLARLEGSGFQDFHAFPYSERPGTPAEGITPRVPPAVRRERMGRLGALKERLRRRTAEALEGRVEEVVAEGHPPSGYGGTTPEGVRVVFRGPEGLLGRTVRVRAAGFRKGQIEALYVE